MTPKEYDSERSERMTMNKENGLLIDHQTLEDLEIFRPKTGDGIFDIVDNTVTEEGKNRLKKRFRNPCNNLKDILNIQDTIKHILSDPKKWELPFSSKQMDLTDMYYYSKVTPVHNNNRLVLYIEGIVYYIFLKKYRETAIKGARYFTHFLSVLYSYYLKNNSNELPYLLSEIFKYLEEFFGLQIIRQHVLNKTSKINTLPELILLDKIFREKYKSKIITFINSIYELDALISMAKSTEELNLSFPEPVDSDSAVLHIEGLYHLFLNNPQKNDAILEKGKNFMFLTGPNMAGKTTYLKSAGIAVYLAHLGMGVPADKMRFSVFNSIFSSLNASDNIRMGYSYFYSEVLRVKKAAEVLRKSKKAFIIFDELFKGTNIKDAFDGSLMVISGLVNWDSGIFILSSHLLELAKDINKYPGMIFKYFESDILDGKPVFSYQLKEGVSDERLGLLIIQNEKIMDLLKPE